MTKTYIYANGEILAQHDGDSAAARYFYLHDRLGSVRQIINTNGSVVRYYTFGPFGATLEEGGILTNPFMFTGQYYDSEIGQYYLRARQYDPQLMRFTARDPVKGRYREPMTLHKYLYCVNNSTNFTDPSGNFSIGETVAVQGIFGAVFGAMQDGMQGAVTGGLLGLAGGGASAWLSTAGFMGTILSEVVCNAGINMAQDTAYNLITKHKTDVASTITAALSFSFLDAGMVGFGRTAGKDMIKSLKKKYGEHMAEFFVDFVGESIRLSGWEGVSTAFDEFYEGTSQPYDY